MNQLDFWHAYIDSRNVVCKFLAEVVKKAHSQSNFEILKSTISQEQRGHSV